MPWRRWSVSRAALKAVTGQFVGRQSALSAVILCVLAAWFGASADLRVNPRIAVTGLVLAAVGLSATIASAWIGSGRWDDLARFPLGRDELARATYLVADVVILFEAVAPITLFVLLSSGEGSGRSPGIGVAATTAVEMVVVGLGAGVLPRRRWIGASWGGGRGGGGGPGGGGSGPACAGWPAGSSSSGVRPGGRRRLSQPSFSRPALWP